MIIISLLLLVCNLLGISLFPAVTLVRFRFSCWVTQVAMDIVIRLEAKADLLATWFLLLQAQFALHWVVVYIVTIFAAIVAIKVVNKLVMAYMPPEMAIMMQENFGI